MNEERIGILYGFSAYLLWGFLPLYWKLVESVPAWEVLAHRVIWSFVFYALLHSVYPTVAAIQGRIQVCFFLLEKMAWHFSCFHSN